MLVALRSAICRRRPKRCRAYKKTVECPATVPVALSTTVRRAKRRVARLRHLLMSANIEKHGIERKSCDARQHFIQTDRMANKMQRFVRCIHCTNTFEKGVPGAHEVLDVQRENNAMESHLRQCKFYEMQDMQMFDPEPSTSQAQHPGAGPPTSSQTSTNHNSSKRAHQQLILKYCPVPILNEEKIEFHSLLLEFQTEVNLPESFVSR